MAIIFRSDTRTGLTSKADGKVQINDAHRTLKISLRARWTVHQVRLCKGYVIATHRSTVNVTVNQTLEFDEKSAIGRNIIIRMTDIDLLAKHGFCDVFNISVINK